MVGKRVRRVGVALKIIPIRLAVAEQAMHHRASERPVGAGTDQHRQVGLLHRGVHVDVDHRDLGIALFARAGRMRHHIDLRIRRIGAPDHHQIRLRHFARIGAGKLAGAGNETGEGRIDADRGKKAGIFLGVAQAMNAVAHHIAHGAGIEVGPHRLRAVLGFGALKRVRDNVECVVPGDWRKFPAAFGAGAPQRLFEPIGMMDALGVAGDLGADHACRIKIVFRTAHAADRAAVEHFHFKRAGGRAIVRARGGADLDRL